MLSKQTKDQIAREAEARYPFGQVNFETITGRNDIMEQKQSAYIAGAETWAERGEVLKTENAKMRRALEVIANWQLPPTGKVWDNDNAQPISFEAEYGSNGARDYMKQVATEALKNNTHG